MGNEEISTRLVVLAYDQSTDTFECEIEDLNYDYDPFGLPALLLPMLVGESGEPEKFVGNTYELRT